MKEYLLTYRHTNDKVIGPKRVVELDLEGYYKSPFVEDILALTTIDFTDWKGTRKRHDDKVQESLRLRQVWLTGSWKR